MSKVRVESLSISLDGYVAGPEQSLEQPLGVGGPELHTWALATRTFQEKVFATGDGALGVDNDFAVRGFENIGAWILGRNMFGPIRGPWPDQEWKGWWGDNPPYHVPAFILTHYPRESLVMDGGTTFHFVTGGIHEALQFARRAAGTKDVRIGGGAATIRQYLRERLIDEMHFVVTPAILGSGERLFDGVDLRKLGYACTQRVGTETATHFVLTKMGDRHGRHDDGVLGQH